jgi:hypothetical protein
VGHQHFQRSGVLGWDSTGGDRVAAATVTTLVLLLFGAAVLAFAIRNLFGNWEPIVKRTPEREREAEVQRAIRRLHAEIDRFERGD